MTEKTNKELRADIEALKHEIDTLRSKEDNNRQTERLLREALDNFADHVILYDKNERVVFTNNRYHEIYPHAPPKDEIVGCTFEQLLRISLKHGQIDHPLAKSDPDAWVAMRIAERHNRLTFTGETTHTSGRTYIYRHSLTSDGGVILVQTDITEHKHALEKIAGSEALLQVVLDNMPSGIRCFDKDDTYLFFNSSYSALWDLPDGLLKIGEPLEIENLYLAKRGDYGEGDPKELARGVQNANEWALEPHYYERTTLRGRILACSTHPTDGGGHISVHTDITERNRAETEIKKQHDELEKLNDQKDKFFSIIAHDLKGPFTALLGLTELLADPALSFDANQIKGYAKSVNHSAEQIYNLLENLLEWALLQMGQMEFEPSCVDVTEIINRNLDLFAPMAKEKEILLTGMGKTSFNVLADAHMLDTIVRNLINNAIKFTAIDGGVSIKTKCQDDWAAIEVSDTGIGITADRMDQLFQMDSKTSTLGTIGERGTGLGLNLCKELVEKQGGQISVKSKEGEVSVFNFMLPLYGDTNPTN